MLPLGDKARRFTHTLPISSKSSILPPVSPCPPPPPGSPQHTDQDAGSSSPVTHLGSLELGSGMREAPLQPPPPRQAQPSPSGEQTGLVQGLGGHTGQSLSLHLPGSHPSGTGARLQRPPATGEGKDHTPNCRGQAKEKQDGATSFLSQEGQASLGAAPWGSGSPAPGMASLLLAPLRVLYWAKLFF